MHSMEFFNVPTGPQLLELTKEHLPEHRERLYPPTVTISMFLGQALLDGGSCQRAVSTFPAEDPHGYLLPGASRREYDRRED